MDYNKYYDLEKYLFNEVHESFKSKHSLTAEQFFCIVIWKSNRSKSKIRNSLANNNQNVKEITEKLYKERDPIKKVNLLAEIEFVGIPIASAILTVCFPDDFTVLDYRVWNILKERGLVDGSKPTTIERYLNYVDICKRQAKQLNVSLRDFDRTMWGKSFYNDLVQFLEAKHKM